VAGYSGTPLAQKLGIKPGGKVFVVRAPRNYRALVAPLPEGATITRTLSSDVHVIHLFATTRKQLESGLRTSLEAMNQDAAIWVSWPKMASKVPTDIREDAIREIAFPLGLVDIKVCAVDETWSGLKLVIRKENRRRGSGKP
jgi:hypothetical protein